MTQLSLSDDKTYLGALKTVYNGLSCICIIPLYDTFLARGTHSYCPRKKSITPTLQDVSVYKMIISMCLHNREVENAVYHNVNRREDKHESKTPSFETIKVMLIRSKKLFNLKSCRKHHFVDIILF